MSRQEALRSARVRGKATTTGRTQGVRGPTAPALPADAGASARLRVITRHTMDMSLQTYYLTDYATKEQWQNSSIELCQRVIQTIFSTPPTENSWKALLELFAAWSNIRDIHQWVDDLEPQINHWHWKMRQSLLGQKHTRGDKKCVYRLVAYLYIQNVEDTTGQKLRQWSRNANWQNLKGISLYKVETQAEDISTFLKSQYLQNLYTLELKSLNPLGNQIGILFNDIQLNHLKELIVRSLNLTVKDIIDLSHNSLSQQLTLLDLSSNVIYDQDLPSILTSAAFPNLKTLNISHTKITLDAIRTAIENSDNTSLEQIIFERTPAAKELGTPSLAR